MYERFGEFNSYEEINQCAEGLFNEGDFDSLRVMAGENGIPEEYVQMYLTGEIPELCDLLTAAIGKIDLEAEQLQLSGIMQDWADYLRGQCVEHEEMAAAVRKSGKNLVECMGALLKWSFRNRKLMNKDIAKAAGVTCHVEFGMPGMGEAKKIIREYYLEENAK